MVVIYIVVHHHSVVEYLVNAVVIDFFPILNMLDN